VYAAGLLVSCALLLTVEEAYHRSLRSHAAPLYGDEKAANRDIRVWHGATETGP
jgi:hypothetical protein